MTILIFLMIMLVVLLTGDLTDALCVVYRVSACRQQAEGQRWCLMMWRSWNRRHPAAGSGGAPVLSPRTLRASGATWRTGVTSPSRATATPGSECYSASHTHTHTHIYNVWGNNCQNCRQFCNYYLTSFNMLVWELFSI